VKQNSSGTYSAVPLYDKTDCNSSTIELKRHRLDPKRWLTTYKQDYTSTRCSLLFAQSRNQSISQSLELHAWIKVIVCFMSDPESSIYHFLTGLSWPEYIFCFTFSETFFRFSTDSADSQARKVWKSRLVFLSTPFLIFQSKYYVYSSGMSFCLNIWLIEWHMNTFIRRPYTWLSCFSVSAVFGLSTSFW